MKNLTTKLMIAAAALAAVAGSASAQSFNAEIPMAFRAGSQLMQPGAYRMEVSITSSVPQVRLQNLDDHRSVFLMPSAGEDAPKAWRAAAKPMAAFECLEGRCVLRTLWTGELRYVYKFYSSITPRSDARAALIVVKLTSAE